MKQKRRYARVHWFFPCRFDVPHAGKDGVKQGWGIIRNVSLKGVELATRFPVEAQSAIFMNFQMTPTHVQKNLPGVVLHVRRDGLYNICGIMFDDHVDILNIEAAMNSLIGLQE